jgi:hypothetical protein
MCWWFLPAILAALEAKNRRIDIRGQPHLQNNQSKVNWRYGSSGRRLAETLCSNPSSTHKHTQSKTNEYILMVKNCTVEIL